MSSIDINPVFWTIGFIVSILFFALGAAATGILVWKGLMLSLDQIYVAVKEKVDSGVPAEWKARS